MDSKDPRYTAVDALIKQTLNVRRHLVTTNYILTELVVLLSSRYHQPRQKVITAINAIKAEPMVEIIHIDQILDNEAWRLLYNSRTGF